MKFNTLFGAGLKRAMLVGALITTLGVANSAAQTFLHEGVVYKVSKTKVNVQKPTTKPENGEAPGSYTGDIVLPAVVSYKDKEYTMGSVGTAFKESEITSIVMPDGATIAQGSFSDCAKLESVVLPSDLPKFFNQVFMNCTSLKSVTIPATVPEISTSAFAGCTSLTEFIIADGENPVAMQATTFGENVIEKLVLGRPIDPAKYTKMDEKPFRGSKTLTSVVLKGGCTTLPSSYFENASNLASVTFESKVTSFDTAVFAGTALTEVSLPEGLTYISSSLFMNCSKLSNVVLPETVTTIDGQAFAGTAIETIALPSSLTSIGTLAFLGSALKGELTLPANLKSVGTQAFANTALTAVTFPATINSIGGGAFMGCSNLASFSVAEGSETFVASADHSYIASADMSTLVAFAPAAAVETLAGDFTAVAPYAVYGAQNIKTVTLNKCADFGDYAFFGSSIEALTVRGTIGRYVAGSCPNLTTITVDAGKIPAGVAAGSAKLDKVILTRPVAVVGQDAFNGCSALTSLDLGNILSILESDCFANSGIKALTVGAYYPAAMSEGVFVEGSDITVTVPESLVSVYKEAAGWKYLNIVGDANLAVGGESLGMPAGLYYAGDDSNLHCVYADGNTDDYEVNLDHMFQLIEFSHRIYGASAGKKFTYSATSATEGDGKLFYISKVGNELFQATVLDNAGNNAYKDPFGLYIYGSTLYVNDRNVCVRKISADAIALPIDYSSWMENNWLPFYGTHPWSYGCIKNGFAITQSQDAEGNPEPLYWVGMKYNGEGLFSFKEANINTAYDSENDKYPDGATAYFTNIKPIATTFNIDEKNGYLYIYIEKAGNEANPVKGGLYRIKLENLEQNPDPAIADFMESLEVELVDGAPVRYEGSSTNEHVGISQLSIDADGEYMYWCYRAADLDDIESREASSFNDQVSSGRYAWAETYDAENPLHHSGIKRIKLGKDLPKVEMVAPGVEGYGVVAVNFEGSTKPSDGVQSVVTEAAANLIVLNGDEVVATAATTLTVYNAAGLALDIVELAAGQAYSTADLAAGMYILEANNGAAKQAVKVVK